jgi:hypothetical protein
MIDVTHLYMTNKMLVTLKMISAAMIAALFKNFKKNSRIIF